MIAFVLDAVLRLTKDGFDEGMKDAVSTGSQTAQKLAKGFETVQKAFSAIASVKAIQLVTNTMNTMVNNAATYGDHIDKTSQQLGLTYQEYQEWSYILGQNGADIDSMGRAMAGLNDTTLNFRQASPETREAFKQLGLNLRELSQMTPGEQFEAVVTAFQEMPDGANKSALAMTVFGQAGRQLMPLLNGTAEGTDELRQNAHDMGIILSDEAVASAAAFGDALDDMKKITEGLGNQLGASMHDPLREIIRDLNDAMMTYIPGFVSAWDKMWNEFATGYNREDRDGIWGILSGLIDGTFFATISANDSMLKAIFPFLKDTEAREAAGKEVGEGIGKIVKGIGDFLTAPFKITTPNEEETEQIRADVEKWWGMMEIELDKEFDVSNPDADQTTTIETNANSWWDELVLNFTKIFDVEKPDDKSTEGIKRGADSWWDELKLNFVKTFIVGNPDTDQTTDIETNANTWWSGLGLDFSKTFDVNHPDDETTGNAIARWWNEFKKQINLVIGFDVLPTDEVPETIFNAPKVIRPSVRTGMTDWTTKNQQHATGLDYVPYDGYTATLHRGESVLTSLEAMQWRNGTGRQSAQPIDYDKLAATVANAVSDAISSIEIGLDGKAISNRVSRDIAARTRQRRYSRA